jgi:hypothetical protein
VTIVAAGEVGMVRPPTVIALADIQNSRLSDAEKAALALAHVAGEALLVGTDSQGQTVTFPDGQTPAGVTVTGVQVAIHRPLLVAASNSPAAALNVTVLNVNAPGGITVAQTVGDLVLGTIDSDGAVDLAATGSIINAQTVISGFGNNGTGWTTNLVGDSATFIAADVLTLTDNNSNQARSAWFNTPVSTGSFMASFVYQASGDRAADGVTFAFQNQGVHALGSEGGSLGYGGITGPSAAYQINLYDGLEQGTNFVTDGPGEVGTTGNYLATNPVDVTSGNPIHVALTYDAKAGTLTETLTDQATAAIFSRTYSGFDLASLLGPTAYVGFTGASGGATATQTIRDFQFVFSNGQLSAPDVTLQSLSGSIGRADDPLRMAVGDGQFNALAATGVSVLQTSGNLNVGQVVTDQGDIFLDPPEAGQSIILQDASRVSAPHGHVMFQAHNDVHLAAGSIVEALTVTIQGGFANLAAVTSRETGPPDARITLAGALHAASVVILGGGGNDTVWIGSDGHSPGSLDRILGRIEFRGGGGADALHLDDRAAVDAAGQPLRAGYAITPNQVGNNPGLGFAERAFAGLTYDASATQLQVLGAAGSAVFHVKPSADTEFHMLGHPDASGGLFGGNSLILDETGIVAATRGHLSSDAGTWSFAAPHRPIQFTGVPNFHRLTFGVSAGATTIRQATTSAATFVVTYHGLTALDLDGGLGEHDALRVVGPNGYSQLAEFVGVTPSFDGRSQIATYRVPAPGGGWNAADNGAYSIEILPGQISDSLGRDLPAAPIGALWVNIDSLWLTSTLQAAGQYRLDVAGASPGGTVVFVRGNQAGQYPLGSLGLTLDVADPVVLGEVVVDLHGRAQWVVQVPPESAGELLGFQAFEQAPAPLASQLVYAEPTPRLISSIQTIGQTVASGLTVQFLVTFAQPVAGVSVSDFVVVTGHHVADARITGISGHGAVYTVTVETGSGDGTLTLNLKDEASIATATGTAANLTRNGSLSGPAFTIHKMPEDVNLDFAVTALDALVLINSINRNLGPFIPDGSDLEPWWHDVNGDGWISPLDVLIVVNHVNRQTATGEGEDAAPADSPFTAPPLDSPSAHPAEAAGPTSPLATASFPDFSAGDRGYRRYPFEAFTAPRRSMAATTTELEDALADIAVEVGLNWQAND